LHGLSIRSSEEEEDSLSLTADAAPGITEMVIMARDIATITISDGQKAFFLAPMAYYLYSKDLLKYDK
jgi:hypothetical protein